MVGLSSALPRCGPFSPLEGSPKNDASKRCACDSWNVALAEYGTVRVVFLVKDDQSSSPIYTLPIKRVEGRWAQTDTLAADPGFYEIFDRIGRAILERHPKR